MTTSSRKRQREDIHIAKSKDENQVARKKKKKRSAPVSQSTKPPTASESGSKQETPLPKGTSPQSKPRHKTYHDVSNHKTNPPRNFWTVDSTFSPPKKTRPRTPRRPLARAQPNTPPMTDEAWAMIFYDADFGSKVCERFEKRQRDRPAK
jgi:hypothetical protein